MRKASMKSRKRMKTRTRILAGLLCITLIFADVMSTGLVAQAAEITQQNPIETEMGESITSDESLDEEGKRDISDKEMSEEGTNPEVTENDATKEAQIPSEDAEDQDEEAKIPSEATESQEDEAQTPSDEQADTENGETGEEEETSEEENPEEETEVSDIDLPEADESAEIKEAESVMPLAIGDIVASGTYTKGGSNTAWRIGTASSDGTFYKLTVTGTGEVRGNNENVPWEYYSGWIVEAEIKVTGMKDASNLFQDCYCLRELDLSGFDTRNVTDISKMFRNCQSLTELDVSGFDTRNVTKMWDMFSGCSRLTKLDVSGFDTRNVTDMYGMFSDCSSLTELDVSGFDTHNVLDMSGMFSGCSSLTELDVSGFDTRNVLAMQEMFYGCNRLRELGLSCFNTSNVRGMSRMFSGCSHLTGLDVSGFDTRNVALMNDIFRGCIRLTELDVSGFNTGNVTNMSGMFADCNNLRELDVSGFDTRNVIYMHEMFYYCNSLTKLDLSSFDTSNVIDMGSMLEDCSSLTAINTPLNVKEAVSLPDGDWYRTDTRETLTELPKNLSVSILLKKTTNQDDSDSSDDQPGQKKVIHIVGLEKSYEYTGAKIIPNIGVIDYDADGGKLLTPGVDYTVKYKNNTKVGTAEITVTGKGNYTGKCIINEKFNIIDAYNAKTTLENLNGAKITDIETGLTYDGEAKYPKFTLTLNGGTPKQYEYNEIRGVYETADGEKAAIPANVALSNNINKGTATILLKGADDTKIKKTFKIAAIDLAANAGKVKVEIASATYAVKGATPASITVTYGGKKLKNGTDYTVKYSSNKKATTAAKVVITGKGNYAKKYSSATFTIEKLDLSNVEVRAVTAYADLKAGKVKATVVDGQGNALKPSQYTLYVYKDKESTSPCDATEVLAAKSKIYVEAVAKDTVNLDGVTPRCEFDVSTNIAKAKVTDKNGKTITKSYTGTPIMFTDENTAELKVTLNGTNLTMGTDYEIVSYSNNTNKGTATAVLKGIGSYSGTTTFKFKISAKQMQIDGKSKWDDIVDLIKGFIGF